MDRGATSMITHLTFRPVTVTPILLHSTVQGINKDTPFSTAASTTEPQVPPTR